MASQPQFPGMNPYLEHPSLWPEVHSGLIGALMRTLNRQITPRYRAAMEKRVYMDMLTVIVPDSTVFETGLETGLETGGMASRKPITASPARRDRLSGSAVVLTKPERVALPIPEGVTERFLEIREPRKQRVVTVVEILSPKNKRAGEGRTQYLKKRQQILGSSSHFVEIDLLRVGDSMPLSRSCDTDYEILVSRVEDRPIADRYGFDLQEPIPRFTLPLDYGETEPLIDLKALLDQVYQEAALDLEIDYSAVDDSQPPR